MSKKSKYNFFVPYKDNTTIVYNTFSARLALFDNHTISRYNNNQLEENEIEMLKERGFIIDDNYDEGAIINEDRITGIRRDSIKILRIWTTSACNANCEYCFEKGLPVENMSIDTANQIYQFIEKRLVEEDSLCVEWFGGEPLLNYTIIDYLSEQLINLCEKRHCSYSATIISNGSLVTDSIVKKMKTSWKIKSIQITMDGYGDVYERIKDYKAINNAFDRVISNIDMVSNSDIYVSIRMNYANGNTDTLLQLLDFLYERYHGNKNVGYYLHPLWDSLNENSEDQFISESVDSKNYIKLIDKMVSYGIASPRVLLRLLYRKRQCEACLKYGYAIYPNGDLGKCSEAYCKPIGNVWEGITNYELSNIWLDETIEEKCQNCVFLPMCQGGCRASRVTKMPQCFSNKKILPDILKWYVEYQMNKSTN